MLALHAGIEKASHFWGIQMLIYSPCLEILYVNIPISMGKPWEGTIKHTFEVLPEGRILDFLRSFLNNN